MDFGFGARFGLGARFRLGARRIGRGRTREASDRPWACLRRWPSSGEWEVLLSVAGVAACGGRLGWLVGLW